MTAPAWAAASGARALVFVADPADLAEPMASVWIDGDDGHHLRRVRRLDVDETVVVADGAGRWTVGPIVEVGPGAVRIAPAGAVRVEPRRSPSLTIAFSPAKRDHGTEVVHQLVELGVDRIVPLRTERGVVRWDGARGEKQLERLRRVAREAAMQSLRACIPEIAPPVTPAELVAAHPTGLLVADPGGSVVSATVPADTGELVVLVGPEGGFAPAEVAAFAACRRVAIGPHVLRAVTAPAAVAAAIASLR